MKAKDEVSLTLSRALAEAFGSDGDAGDVSRASAPTASMRIELVGVSVSQVRSITLRFAGDGGKD
ncbi:MAG: hypothetical protein JSS57_00270 [Proteobacteria bacterium]|nr:hypothetical protein [Pseudomonadota bacterium]